MVEVDFDGAVVELEVVVEGGHHGGELADHALLVFAFEVPEVDGVVVVAACELLVLEVERNRVDGAVFAPAAEGLFEDAVLHVKYFDEVAVGAAGRE